MAWGLRVAPTARRRRERVALSLEVEPQRRRRFGWGPCGKGLPPAGGGIQNGLVGWATPPMLPMGAGLRPSNQTRTALWVHVRFVALDWSANGGVSERRDEYFDW